MVHVSRVKVPQAVPGHRARKLNTLWYISDLFARQTLRETPSNTSPHRAADLDRACRVLLVLAGAAALAVERVPDGQNLPKTGYQLTSRPGVRVS